MKINGKVITMKTLRNLKLISCLSIAILILQNCNDHDLTINYSSNYPSSYSKLDSITYNQLKTKFAGDNPFLRTSVTIFGFCGNSDLVLSAPWPSKITDLTGTEAKNKVLKFISQNSKQTGVVNPSDVTFARVDSSRVYDGSLSWFVLSNNQIYNGLEVYNSAIRFIIINGEITNCQGNWYPLIYIPSKINVDEEKAKSLLLNKTVYLSDFIGRSIPMTITAKSLETATFTKLIYPVETSDKINLHVAWQVNISAVFYVIFVDVMTGELIGSYPTAIS
jgi:hypothetical protein